MSEDAYKLTITEGSSSSQDHHLTKTEIILGRDENADCMIPIPSVSRRQARITWRDSRYWIEDLGSSNGTFINGNRLTYNSVALTERDHIQFGQSVTLVFERIASQGAATSIGRSSLARSAETIVDAKII